jgi:hypothetical protein
VTTWQVRWKVSPGRISYVEVWYEGRRFAAPVGTPLPASLPPTRPWREVSAEWEPDQA